VAMIVQQARALRSWGWWWSGLVSHAEPRSFSRVLDGRGEYEISLTYDRNERVESHEVDVHNHRRRFCIEVPN
jgi:hypothetical protein